MNPDSVTVYCVCPNCAGVSEIQIDPTDGKPVPTEVMCKECEATLEKLNQDLKDKKEGKFVEKKKKKTPSGNEADMLDEFFKMLDKLVEKDGVMPDDTVKVFKKMWNIDKLEK